MISAIKVFLNGAKQFAVKHAPGILMGMGTVATGTSVIFAAKAGERMNYVLANAQQDKYNLYKKIYTECHTNADLELTKKEKFSAVWRLYIPAAGFFIIGIGCFWGAHWVDIRRQAVLAGLYSTAEAALQEYQKKVVDMMGKETDTVIKDSIKQDKVDKMPPPPAVPMPGMNVWCIFDGEYFPSTYLKIKNVENQFNHDMIRDMYGSVADLKWMLDPSRQYLKKKPNEGQVGYCVDKLITLNIEPKINPDGEQCFMVECVDEDGNRYDPKPGFSTLY